MRVEDLAARLTGMAFGSEIPRELEKAAASAGQVIVFGSGDDLMVFRGAVHDEAEACHGQVVLLDAEGVLPSWEDVDTDDVEAARAWFRREMAVRVAIEALWCSEGGYLWTFRAGFPHATFEMTEAGEPCCRGLVFGLADAMGRVAPTDPAFPRKEQEGAAGETSVQPTILRDPVMLPIPEEGYTEGWVITTYGRGSVERAWSRSATHHRGPHEDPGQVRQGGIRLYATERDAWIALRIAKERQFAAALADLDEEIAARRLHPGSGA